MRIVRKVLLLALVAFVWPSTSFAAVSFDAALLDVEIVGGRFLVATPGNVQAQFLGSDAGYFNTLYLDSPGEGLTYVFSKSTAMNHVIDLGGFDEGQELIFRLDVSETSESFFSGPAIRNDDGLAHAVATTTMLNGTYMTTVGFEDLFGGGDLDYNDFMFSLSNVVDPPAAVPAPATLSLLTLGLLGAGFARKRRTH